ncbi:unnamed protein product [Paramecium primaurelia]|uniref:PH domain-containing protein n=1 Tax=Paramecium primaurelia TaxID=5886 RepID=A0A8S1MKW2_PARPR|nr:unnamed protein product [Paramecium primaurelia]
MEEKVQKQYIDCVKKLQRFIQNYPDRVPGKVQQKLQVLQASIDNHKFGKTELLSEEEIQQLINPPIPVKFRMYIDIVNSFIYSEDEVQGRLEMKKKSGWFWNNKILKLNMMDRKLMISRNDPKKRDKQLALSDFSLKWCESMKNKYCFQLCGKETFLFGSEDLQQAERWFNYLRQCCAFIDDDQLKKIKQQKQFQRQSEDLSQSLNIYPQKRSEIIQSKPQNMIDDKQKTHHKTQSQVTKPINDNTQKSIEQKQQIIEKEQSVSVISVQNVKGNQNNITQPDNKVPALLQNILLNKELYSIDRLMDDSEYQLISFKNKLRLLQHKTQQEKIKAIVNINSDNVIPIVSALVCPDVMKQWNTQIDQTIILDIMINNNSMIISEMRKKYGLLYLKRSYTYLRYVFKDKDTFFIIDKSLSYQNNIQNGYQFEGQIQLSIIAVIPQQQQQVMIIWETETKNGGYANDAQLSLHYVSELQNLDSYLIQKQFKIPIPQIVEQATKDPLNVEIIEQYQPQRVIEVQMDSSLSDVDCKQFQSQIILDDEPELINKNDYLQLLDLVAKNPGMIYWSAIHHYQLTPLEPDNIYYTETAEHKNIILQSDWEILEKGGLRFINKKKLEIQKEVITFMLKKLGSNLLMGKSLISISLPVNIFERRSNLERACYSMGYMWLLEKAGELSDPLEQMKLVAQFSLAYNIMFLNMEKPFNPILGETFQGYMNGNLLYCEQISHHPPVLGLYVLGRNFKLTGHLESQANFSANSITGQNYGYLQVTFPNNTSIIFNVMPGVIQGMTIGHRQFYYNGVGWLVDLENKLFCDIIVTAFPGMFSKKVTPQDFIEGYIMKGSVKDVNKFNQETYRKYQGIKALPQQDRLSNISGRWTTGMIIDGVEVLNWFKHFPYKLKYEEYPLASDSNYREDLIALKTGDLNLAQDRKEKMEINQRHDKKIRQKKKH